MTLNDHYAQFIAAKSKFIARNTLHNYHLYFYRYISPTWGYAEIADIDRAQVAEQFYNWVNCGAPVREIRKYLSAIWSDLPGKPTIGLRLPRRIPRYNLLTHDEMQKGIRDGAEHRYYAMFLTLALTGMRPAELRGLRWEDIDFDTSTIYIQRIYNMGQVGPTKTDQSVRAIVMPQRLAVCLQSHKTTSKSKWVFTSRYKDPICASSTLRNRLHVFCTDVGIKYVSPYTFRHYFAASCIDNGVPVTTVQRYCGWSNSEMALYYAARQGRRGATVACALLDGDDF